MDYVDSYIPLPKRKVDGDFMLPIEGVYSIAGRGTVCTGNIERGKVIVGDELEIVGFNDKPIKTTVTGVETFKSLDHGEAGDNVGLLLRGVNRGDIKRGMVVCKPGSQNTAKKFQAEIYVLSKDEGGRHTPFFSDYRPQFFSTTDITGNVTLPKGTEMVMPGDNTTVNVELINDVVLEKGMKFAVREGGKTVASGVITQVN